MASPSSASLPGAAAGRAGGVRLAAPGGAPAGPALRTGFFTSTTGSAAAAAAAGGFFATATPLRACTVAGRTRLGSALRALGFLTAGRLAAFLPFADFGADRLAGIKGS